MYMKLVLKSGNYFRFFVMVFKLILPINISIYLFYSKLG